MIQTKPYKLMVFLGTGAVGDFVMMLDMALRAHKAAGTKSIFIVKNNATFLHTFLAQYPFAKVERFSLASILKVFFMSFRYKTCIMWETANQGYGKRVFLFFRIFHHLTPARIIALQAKDEFSFLGNDAMPFKNDRYMYQIGIQMLEHAGFTVGNGIPHIDFAQEEYILEKNGLKVGNYIVICPTTSGYSEVLRTLPDWRWGGLLTKILAGREDLPIVFVGGPGEKKAFERISSYLDPSVQDKVLMFDGNLSASEMMTLFSNAKLFIGLRTGTTLVAACIDTKGTIILLDARMKETIWFYDFNKNIISLTNRDECKCRSNALTCYVRDEKDRKLYHRCNYFVPDEVIVSEAKKALAKNNI